MPDMMCPECGVRLRYDFARHEIRCPQCDYSPLEATRQQVKARGPRPSVVIRHRGEVTINARIAFNTAHDYLYRDEPEKAIAHFQRALTFQPAFTDAHLALADLVPDEATKRHHLSEVIAVDPGNGEALRRLMVLNGRLQPEQVAQTYHADTQQIMQVNEVISDSEALLCPQCGGHLTVSEQTGQVLCKFCGYVPPVYDTQDVRLPDSLTMALLERKIQPVRWVVGQRILHCNECGAERTIPAHNLTHQCPFCGSQHVIQQDAIESLQQPDSLILFKITRQQASAAIRRKLQRAWHRFANLFDNNRIAGGVLQPVYLPFWVFDAFGEVNVTRTRTGQTTRDVFTLRDSPAVMTMQFSDQVADVLVCGVEPPVRSMTDRLGAYDFGTAVPYRPALLARHAAQLYTQDFDAASLAARGTVAQMMREKYTRLHQEDNCQISVFMNVQHMDFKLWLLPVWVASLVEQDGDTRSALVNGQTGQVVLGKTKKRR